MLKGEAVEEAYREPEAEEPRQLEMAVSAGLPVTVVVLVEVAKAYRCQSPKRQT
jgi:hypothetical protein